MSRRNRLRAPTTEERRKGLPTSKADALKAGLTRFIPKDGEERIIRNHGSRSKPNGTVVRASNRKATRGGGSDGSRARAENVSTPPGTNRNAFGAAMTAARQQGMDGDHINDVARTGRGYKGKAMRRRLKMMGRFASVGTATGNHPFNVQPLSVDDNQRVKPGDQRALDNKLKEMNQRNPPRRQPKPGRITGPKAISSSIPIPRSWTPTAVQDHVDFGLPHKPPSQSAAFARAVQMINNAQPTHFHHPGSIPIYIP